MAFSRGGLVDADEDGSRETPTTQSTDKVSLPSKNPGDRPSQSHSNQSAVPFMPGTYRTSTAYRSAASSRHFVEQIAAHGDVLPDVVAQTELPPLGGQTDWYLDRNAAAFLYGEQPDTGSEAAYQLFHGSLSNSGTMINERFDANFDIARNRQIVWNNSQQLNHGMMTSLNADKLSIGFPQLPYVGDMSSRWWPGFTRDASFVQQSTNPTMTYANCYPPVLQTPESRIFFDTSLMSSETDQDPLSASHTSDQFGLSNSTSSAVFALNELVTKIIEDEGTQGPSLDDSLTGLSASNAFSFNRLSGNGNHTWSSNDGVGYAPSGVVGLTPITPMQQPYLMSTGDTVYNNSAGGQDPSGGRTGGHFDSIPVFYGGHQMSSNAYAHSAFNGKGYHHFSQQPSKSFVAGDDAANIGFGDNQPTLENRPFVLQRRSETQGTSYAASEDDAVFPPTQQQKRHDDGSDSRYKEETRWSPNEDSPPRRIGKSEVSVGSEAIYRADCFFDFDSGGLRGNGRHALPSSSSSRPFFSAVAPPPPPTIWHRDVYSSSSSSFSPEASAREFSNVQLPPPPTPTHSGSYPIAALPFSHPGIPAVKLTSRSSFPSHAGSPLSSGQPLAAAPAPDDLLLRSVVAPAAAQLQQRRSFENGKLAMELLLQQSLRDGGQLLQSYQPALQAYQQMMLDPFLVNRINAAALVRLRGAGAVAATTEMPQSPSLHGQTGVRFPKRSGPATELHLRLESCYEQFRNIENERKRTEAELARQNPGKLVSSANNHVIPRLTVNPSRIDRLIVESFREHANVTTLIMRMEHIRGSAVPTAIHETMVRWAGGINKLQGRRRDEIINASNRHFGGGPQQQKEKDILALASAMNELSFHVRQARTALWSALQLSSRDLPKECLRSAERSAAATTLGSGRDEDRRSE